MKYKILDLEALFCLSIPARTSCDFEAAHSLILMLDKCLLLLAFAR